MAPQFVDLPCPLLEAIAALLDAEERVFLFATCRRLRDLERAAPAAWERVWGVVLSDPAQALRCGRWLHVRRGAIRHLQLALRFDDKSGAHASLLCAKLAGAPLAVLELHSAGSLEVGPLVCGLPALEVLQVAASGEGRVSLKAPLASAALLRTLRAAGAKGVDMDPDCLPPQLEQADIQQPPTTAVRALAGTLGLRRLTLGRCRAALECSQLSQLGSLTQLSLSGCHLAFVPAQLSALTQLEELSLATNRLEGAGWAHLLPLTCLSRLDLRHQLGNRRLQLPAGLLALRSLQEALLADNPFTECLPTPAAGPAVLGTLSLDFEVAARSHAAFARLTSLTQLWLVAASGQVGVAGPAAADAAALLRALSRIPGLRVRWWDSLNGRAEFDLSQPLHLAGLVLRVAQRYPPLLGMCLAV